MNWQLDKQFELLDRFNLLQDLGFKKCIYVSERDTHIPVYSISTPDQGLTPSEIINMPNDLFATLVNCYIN